jgi:hypothetical protein
MSMRTSMVGSRCSCPTLIDFPGAVEDGPHLLVAQRLDRIADGRIGGDAPAETDWAAVAFDLVDLSHQIDVRHALKVLLLGGRRGVHGDFRDRPDNHGFAALDLDELADRDAGTVQAPGPLAHQADADLRAANGMEKAPRHG